ncbi:MAG: STM4012 family radical SAM protein [Pirellulaceae bacterium]
MLSKTRPSLEEFLQQGPYVGYSYSYPHKTAYRAIEHPPRLSQLWSAERQDSLFLYVHIPFCEMRCGFCNLFTFSQPQQDVVSYYLDAIDCQAKAIQAELPDVRFSRIAIGGGTPSFLNLSEMQRLFETIQGFLGRPTLGIPMSFEVSPATVTREKLELLEHYGVERVSMGVQSFDASDVAAMGRPQNLDTVVQAVEWISDSKIPSLNLDLIYGADSQTLQSWLDSVQRTIAFEPEEIYLYPLYVRPLTGLNQVHRQPSDTRVSLYRAARDELLAAGYEQVSMRMFRRSVANRVQPICDAPDYSCQRDGMIGLGCGARSYTQSLHYGSPYAVKQKSVLTLIHQFSEMTSSDFQFAKFGIRLDEQEQRRRYVILTLLLAEGLSLLQYYQFFGSHLICDFPELEQLEAADLCKISDERIQLTPRGLEWSDTIGPWLYSDAVRCQMEGYEWIG